LNEALTCTGKRKRRQDPFRISHLLHKKKKTKKKRKKERKEKEEEKEIEQRYSDFCCSSSSIFQQWEMIFIRVLLR